MVKGELTQLVLPLKPIKISFNDQACRKRPQTVPIIQLNVVTRQRTFIGLATLFVEAELRYILMGDLSWSIMK